MNQQPSVSKNTTAAHSINRQWCYGADDDANSVVADNKTLGSSSSSSHSSSSSIEHLLQSATPNTWLHKKIATSTPVLAGEIFTQFLTVKSRKCVYMESDSRPMVLLSSMLAKQDIVQPPANNNAAATTIMVSLKPASFSTADQCDENKTC